MGGILRDIRYAARVLLQNPGFTAVAVLTLALGIGANTAMFGIVNGVLLAPLPYPDAERLTLIWTRWNAFGQGSISQPEYFDLVERTESWKAIGLVNHTNINLVDGQGEPERIRGARVTPSVFEALGVPPVLGRTFRADEWIEGNHQVAVIGHDLWQRRFGGDPSIIGTRVTVGEDRLEIVGVMPAGYAFPRQTQMWIAYGMNRDELNGRGSHSNFIIARLAPGVPHERAQADLDRLSALLNEEYSDNYPAGMGFGFFTRSLLDEYTGDVRPALLTLLGAVGLVLLIACANVANLLLARISGRGKEIAVRASLGAGRWRIAQQIVTESLVLSAIGGIGALAVAFLATRALLFLQPRNLPRLDAVGIIDPTVLAFTATLVVLTGVAFGLVPAWRVAAGDLTGQLKEGGRHASGGLRSRARTTLVVSEVALATVLLIGAGLLLRSIGSMLSVDPGLASDRVITTRIALDGGRYGTDERMAEFFRRLIDDLEAQPGVAAAGAVNLLPLTGSNSDWSVGAEGYDPPADRLDFIQYRIVSPNYFDTLRIPIVRGRAFDSGDRIGGARSAILSQSLARKFWGDEDPIGRRVRPGGLDSNNDWLTVVGVVGDVHHDGLDAGAVPIWYRPLYDVPWSSATIAVRTSEASEAPERLQLIRDSVARIDPLQPVYGMRSMDEVVARSLADERFNATLFSVFALLALSLAGIGVYGVIGYSVSQRTQEIGVRVALGARRRDILGMILGQGMTLAAIGVGAGLVGALLLTRFLATLLFGVTPRDALTFATVSGFILLTALWACLVPARQATRVDPIVAVKGSD